MKKLILNLVLVSVLFGLDCIVRADEPFVSVSTTPAILDLGYFPYSGEQESSAVLTIVVTSNCLHGPILASLTELKHIGGTVILPEDVSVKAPITGGFISMKRPVAISKSTIGSHSIMLNFKVNTGIEDRAGKYDGTLVLTIMPP